MAYDPDVAITLWPEYFDINLTRAEGRRLPKSLCVPNPNLDIIAKGAMILDLEYEIREDMSYPKMPRAKHGCVKVEKGKLTKTEILPQIGRILVENQGRRSDC
ncbi:signal recognition particle subunit SRP19/SEC65 family protein [Candidatus Methanoprimaticola sp. MG2]|uniref:signal recognition particle subunit SRP19/SEC65 family protein n=1 Tax=Candidatus Methanoprimaticola sp. MG2 TaxID=3228838 RepID=UPI0039C6EFED